MIRIAPVAAMAALFGWTAGCGGGGDSSWASPSQRPLALTFTPVVSGLAAPTVIAHAGDGSGRLFIAEQEGRIRIVNRDGNLLADPFLDLADRLVSGGERGLLGLAFPPGYSRQGHFYVHYTRAPDGATVVSRFSVSADPDAADAESEAVLLTVDQPFANHNGGQLAFGPDGMLYVGLGDGGSGGDPLGNAQNREVLLGKLLRIEVAAATTPYRIPPDNPLAADPTAREEIWALGLRNPWRFSFDRQTGDLYLADVGQSRWEEINFQPSAGAGGANYGWNILEGPECFPPGTECVEPPDYAAPIAFYSHELGCSVTGGYVYRGPGNPDMQGVYFYGDFCSGRVWGLREAGSGGEAELLTQTGFAISTFGEDEAGRLYLADHATGIIYRLDEDG